MHEAKLFPVRFTSILPLFRRCGFATVALVLVTMAGRAETIGNLAGWSIRPITGPPEWIAQETDLVIGSVNHPVDTTQYTLPAPTIGQVITAPTDPNTVLNDFTVVMLPSIPGFHLNLTAAVYSWDAVGFRPIGPALTSLSVSPPLATTESTDAPAYFVDFPIPLHVAVSPGQQYVVLLSTLGMQQSLANIGTSMGVTVRDTYSGGQMVFASAGAGQEMVTPLSVVETERWGETGSCDELNLSSLCSPQRQASINIIDSDLAFSADFGPPPEAAIPEPGSLTCLAGGLATCWFLLGEILRSRSTHFLAVAVDIQPSTNHRKGEV